MATIKWATNSPSAWDTGASWSGGVKPGAGDDAVFDGEFNGNVTAPAAPETVTNVKVSPLYTGSMGASGSPLTVSATNTLSYAGAGAEAWFSGTYNKAVAKSQVVSTGAFNIVYNDSGSEPEMICKSGLVNILSGSGIPTLTISPTPGASFPRVVVASGATVSSACDMSGGTLVMQGTATGSFYIHSGVCTFEDSAWTVLYIMGGLVKVTGTTDITGVDCKIMLGTFDISALKGLQTVTGLISVFPGAVCNLDSGKPITISSGSVTVHRGSTFISHADNVTPDYV